MSYPLPWYLRFQKLPLVILASLLVSGVIGGLRNIGVLERLELWAYDQFIQWRGESEPDSRILLVAIDDQSLKKLNSDKVSDRELTQALKNLEQYNPRVIGVDILRDVPIGEGRQELINYLDRVYEPLAGKVKPIIFTCQLPSAENSMGIDPPPVLDLDSSVGFANIEVDADDVVRRVPIASIPAPNAPPNSRSIIIENHAEPKPQCSVPFSLSFLVSLSYLQRENIKIEQTADGFFKLGDVVFKPPSVKTGSYQNLDASAYQIILDYRLKSPVEQISFAQVLDGQIPAEQVRDRVVLIGYTTNDVDVHDTPYGRVSGVFIHAHVINQVLSNVLDRRSPLWDLPEPVEWLWILGWGVAGGLVAWKCRPNWQLYLGQGGAVVIILGITFISFKGQGWIPLVPPVLSLIISSVAVRSLSQLKLTGEIQTEQGQLIPPVDKYPLGGSLPNLGPTVVSGASSITSGEKQTVWEPPLPSDQSQSKTVVEYQQNVDPSQSKTVVEVPQSENQPLEERETIPIPPTYVEKGSSKRLPEQGGDPSAQGKRDYVRPNPHIGQRIGEGGRYRIDKHLGGGGMGQVYIASDTKLRDKQVAIKVMTVAVNEHQSLIKRFDQEVNVMASFTGVNIVKISDFGLTPEDSPFKGAPFYVMELLQGITLTQRLIQVGRLSVNQAVPIIRQICAGLREAHELGIAHRDLKPDNIYLIPHPALGEIVKILDFGIAKIVKEGHYEKTSHALTGYGAFVGTYRYASPEQCLGDAKIDHRTDIYSLGVLIYEMLSGTNPYNLQEGQYTGGHWISSHISKEPQPIRTQPGCEHISPQIEAVVMKCLAKSPNDRFANVDELENALRQAVGDDLVS